MMDDQSDANDGTKHGTSDDAPENVLPPLTPRALTPPARRALAEAEERRQKRNAEAPVVSAEQNVKEIGGRQGPEPTRFGDWEKGGITSDF